MDINCSLCAEPWDCYMGSSEDMEPEENKLFRAGKGCPSCDFGKSMPLDYSATYQLIGTFKVLNVMADYPHVIRGRYGDADKLLSGSSDHTEMHFDAGSKVTINHVDYDNGGAIGTYSNPAVRFMFNDKYLAMSEKAFRKAFERVHMHGDQARALDLAERSTLQAMDQCDDDPLELLEERGWI